MTDTSSGARTSAERQAFLFEHMLDGVAYSQMIEDEQGRTDWVYLEVNPAFYRLSGLWDVVGKRATQAIPGLRLVGTAKHKAGVLSFVLDGIHPNDIGTVLDYEGIAVRTGHHCAQPVMDRFGIPATTRASLACFNTRPELDALARGIRKVQEMFG
jgi:PAS domain-containing protein